MSMRRFSCTIYFSYSTQIALLQYILLFGVHTESFWRRTSFWLVCYGPAIEEEEEAQKNDIERGG
jgi:hypothetical protein